MNEIVNNESEVKIEMSETDDNVNKNNSDTNKNKTVVKYILSNRSYQLLREVQQEIFEEVEATPSIRKLVNLLITEDNIYKVKQLLIEQLKNE